MNIWENKADDRLTIALKNAPNLKQRQGKALYLKHLRGETLTRSQAIQAKCFECNGDADSCNVVTCSLLPYCQYSLGNNSSTLSNSEDSGDAGLLTGLPESL
jgi:hypothetical protein